MGQVPAGPDRSGCREAWEERLSAHSGGKCSDRWAGQTRVGITAGNRHGNTVSYYGQGSLPVG